MRKGRDVVVIGDGQVSMGGTVFKPNARKVRIIGGGKVICGFAGSTADCFALLDALEKKLEEYPGQLLRAGVELAKMWRTDKFLRHLEVRAHSHTWRPAPLCDRGAALVTRRCDRTWTAVAASTAHCPSAGVLLLFLFCRLFSSLSTRTFRSR